MTPRVLLTNAQKLDRLVTEEELMDYVVTLFKLYRWRWYHTYDSRRSNPGFPDLVAVRDGRVIFAELKRETGKVTPPQQTWFDELTQSGNEVYCWRPSHMRKIGEILR